MNTLSFTRAACRFLVLGTLAGTHSLLVAHDLPAHDAMTAVANTHKVLLENESVRVVGMALAFTATARQERVPEVLVTIPKISDSCALFVVSANLADLLCHIDAE